MMGLATVENLANKAGNDALNGVIKCSLFEANWATSSTIAYGNHVKQKKPTNVRIVLDTRISLLKKKQNESFRLETNLKLNENVRLLTGLKIFY
ncbi:hypothetical protein BpHYR1_015038 [Brachionus plicatilis]|uniref:Uncharacterized protein n=1 Tax=Brachionus plicatilis TaxID=10195 RepID=A0A3M7QJK4_BRAPC|nr:hypothetical protein BpHYR1_015038 [Brachionus plicatilis]